MKSNTLRKVAAPRFQLLLRIKHPSMDPAEITRALRLEPEHAASAGDSVSTAGKRCVHSESYWLTSLPTRSMLDALRWGEKSAASRASDVMPLSKEEFRDLMEAIGGIYDFQLLTWLRKLQEQRDFFKRLAEEGGTVTLVLQRPNRNSPFTLSPKLARQLAELNVRLEID